MCNFSNIGIRNAAVLPEPVKIIDLKIIKTCFVEFRKFIQDQIHRHPIPKWYGSALCFHRISQIGFYLDLISVPVQDHFQKWSCLDWILYIHCVNGLDQTQTGIDRERG